MDLPFELTTKALDTSVHDRKTFSCGKEDLDNYIKKQASQDMKRGLAAVFIIEGGGDGEIAAYYSFSALSVDAGDLTELAAKGLPKKRPVPCTLLGQFAVHKKYQGNGISTWLVAHVMHEVLAHSKKIASFALVVDAVDGDARAYWGKCGFLSFPNSPNRMFALMRDIKEWVAE